MLKNTEVFVLRFHFHFLINSASIIVCMVLQRWRQILYAHLYWTFVNGRESVCLCVRERERERETQREDDWVAHIFYTLKLTAQFLLTLSLSHTHTNTHTHTHTHSFSLVSLTHTFCLSCTPAQHKGLTNIVSAFLRTFEDEKRESRNYFEDGEHTLTHVHSRTLTHTHAHSRTLTHTLISRSCVCYTSCRRIVQGSHSRVGCLKTVEGERRREFCRRG